MKIFTVIAILTLTSCAAPKATIRPAAKTPAPQTAPANSKNQLIFTNTTIEAAILHVYNIHRARLILETNLPPGSYDIFIPLPPQSSTNSILATETAFSDALRANFGLTLQRETRSIDLLVMKTNVSTAEKLARSTSNGKPDTFDHHSITGNHRPLSDLAGGLENAGGNLVLDETGLTNLYSFHLEWRQRDYKHPNGYGMTAAIEHLGLELRPEKRPVQLLILRPVKK